MPNLFFHATIFLGGIEKILKVNLYAWGADYFRNKHAG